MTGIRLPLVMQVRALRRLALCSGGSFVTFTLIDRGQTEHSEKPGTDGTVPNSYQD